MMPEILTLYKLNQMIRSVIETAFPRTFLISAEIASCDIRTHCYLTLVDKQDNEIRAEIRAVIWANRLRVIRPAFEEVTGVSLVQGIKILFQAEISFHERYGLKLNILNIDPSYTIGEMAVRRKEVIDRLLREGLMEKNRALEFPLVPQRIGVISSATAAGYDDLINHLLHNPYGYRFDCRLYEALMQGDRAEASVVAALKECEQHADDLDIVVIVRGGGGQTDLHCFDSYEIGRTIALLSLPVISGIGHHRDVTVVDEVAGRRAKTPTAVADMIITRVREFEDRLNSLSHDLLLGTGTFSSVLRDNVYTLSKRLEMAASKELLDAVNRLNVYSRDLRHALKFMLNQRQRLHAAEINIHHLNPRNVMKRGFSITYHDGSAMKSAAGIGPGSTLRTVFYEGELMSTVKEKSKSRRNA